MPIKQGTLTKKKSKKKLSPRALDAKQISTRQKWEPLWVCRTWVDKDGKHVTKQQVLNIVKQVGRGRDAVRGVLKYLGYGYKEVQRKKK